jgi:hypothetical protein
VVADIGGAGLHGVAFSWKSMVDACLRYQGLEHRSRGRLTPTDTDGIGRVETHPNPSRPRHQPARIGPEVGGPWWSLLPGLVLSTEDSGR